MMQINGATSAAPGLAKLAGGNADVPAGAREQRAQLAQAAKAFEAIFMRQLLGSMRQAGQGEDIAGSSAVDQFRELSDAQLSNGLATKGSLGIAELILKQLDRSA